MLALGAAIGILLCFISSCIILLDGIRTPIVSILQDATSQITFFFFKINVNGPGINASISFCSTSVGFSATKLIISLSLTCIINGLSCALFLALKIFIHASSEHALAAMPYTVSVGTKIRPLFSKTSMAMFNSSWFIFLLQLKLRFIFLLQLK